VYIYVYIVYVYVCMYLCMYVWYVYNVYTIAHVHNQDMLEVVEDVKVGVMAKE